MYNTYLTACIASVSVRVRRESWSSIERIIEIYHATDFLDLLNLKLKN